MVVVVMAEVEMEMEVVRMRGEVVVWNQEAY